MGVVTLVLKTEVYDREQLVTSEVEINSFHTNISNANSVLNKDCNDYNLGTFNCDSSV